MSDEPDQKPVNGHAMETGADVEMGGMTEEEEARQTAEPPIDTSLPPSDTYFEPAPLPHQPSPPRSIPVEAQTNGFESETRTDSADHIHPGPLPDTAPSVAVAPAPIDAQPDPADGPTLSTGIPPPSTPSAQPLAQTQPASALGATSTRSSTPTHTLPTAPGSGVATTLPPSHIIPPANPQGSPTRVYVNTKVTPWLLEGMKWVAANEPEKPLRWLSDFLDRKSKEVEGV